MDKFLDLNNGYKIKVISSADQRISISDTDADMDKRVKQAVKAAIDKAHICNKPIARYDFKTQKAYIEYTDGNKKYVK